MVGWVVCLFLRTLIVQTLHLYAGKSLSDFIASDRH